MNQEVVEIWLNLGVIASLIAIFGWVTKTLIAQNQSTLASFNTFKDQVNQAKNLEIATNNQRYESQIQVQKVEIETLKSQFSSLKEFHAREFQLLEKTSSPELFEHLTSTKESLEKALSETRESLRKKGFEEEELNQELIGLERSIRDVSTLDLSTIERYESRHRDDMYVASWLDSEKQSLATRLKRPSDISRQTPHEFSDECINLVIDWLSRSLRDGDPSPENIWPEVEDSNLAYHSIIDSLRDYSRSNLISRRFDALNFYLSILEKRII